MPSREAIEVVRRQAVSQDFAAAVRICQGWLAENPEEPEILTIYAAAQAKAGNGSLAGELARKAHRTKPDYAEPITVLAALAWRAGNLPEACHWCQEWADLEPNNPTALSNLGVCLCRLQSYERAIPVLEKAAELKPSSAEVRQNLALAYHSAGRLVEAEGEYRKALDLDPISFPILESLATLLAAKAQTQEASELFNRSYEANPDSVKGLVNKARSLICSNENIPQAETFLRRALEIDPDSVLALSLLGFVLVKRGDYREAETSFLRAIKLDPAASNALGDYAYTKKFSEADLPIIERMILMSNDLAVHITERRALKYALGKIHDDLSQYEKAMTFFEEAHDADRQILSVRFNREESSNFIDGLIAEDYGPFATGNPSAQPIFIVGMPRSGTTLVEQILSAHPLVEAGGELEFWLRHAPGLIAAITSEPAEVAREYLSLLGTIGKGAKFVTDKMPDNFLYLGVIHSVLPNARIIHCRRNPADNCLSIYFQFFLNARPYTTMKGDLAFMYRQYERLMEHWKKALPRDLLFEISYEELVSNPRPTVEGLLGFCGLDWDDVCMQPEKNPREILTASHWQVRQPIYRSSMSKWKRYEPWLGELRELVPESEKPSV